VVSKLTTSIRQALDQPETRTRANAAGIELRYLPPQRRCLIEQGMCRVLFVIPAKAGIQCVRLQRTSKRSPGSPPPRG
jgi:hypothetical protein